MRKFLIAAVALCGMTGFALADEAKPAPMTDARLEQIVAGFDIVAFSKIYQSNKNYQKAYAAAGQVVGIAGVAANNAQATNVNSQSNEVN